MKIGAYQFAASKDINRNLEIIKRAIIQASQEGIKLLVFPECALTGYPPRDIENSAAVKFDDLDIAYMQLQDQADDHAMNILVGTITKEDDKFYNSAILFTPHSEKLVYHK